VAVARDVGDAVASGDGVTADVDGVDVTVKVAGITCAMNVLVGIAVILSLRDVSR